MRLDDLLEHHVETPYPTCGLCGAYSIFTMTSDGKRWSRGCDCVQRLERELQRREVLSAGTSIVALRYRYGAAR